MAPAARASAARVGRCVLQLAAAVQLDAQIEQHKQALLDVLARPELVDKGVFGLDDDVEAELYERIERLEQFGPQIPPTSTQGFEILDGRWRVLYTSVVILGKRRTQLGLAPTGRMGAVRLCELYQQVDIDSNAASNDVEFDVLGLARGCFTIAATYETAGENSVQVTTSSAELRPQKLQAVLGEHFNVLLDIFNPEGTLHITYLDSNFRIGRNQHQEIFVLSKETGQNS